MKLQRITSLLALCCACVASALGLDAAEIGSWQAFAAFSAPPQKVVDTGSTVYYVSGGSLFSYDKSTSESYSFTIGNKLTGTSVTDIYYNADKHFLLVAYDSGNIDLLYDDGRVVNMSDIADSQIDPPLTINDVAFDGRNIYVATVFGLVQFDADRHEVVQSGIYSTPIAAVTVVGGRVLIATTESLYHIAVGSRFPQLSYFTKIYDYGQAEHIIPVADNRFIVQRRDNTNTLSIHQVDFANNALNDLRVIASHTPGFDMTRAADGNIYYSTDGAIFAIGSQNFTESRVAMLDDSFDGCTAGTSKGAEEMWTLTRDGLACHGFGPDGSATLLTDRFRPEDFSVREVCYLVPSADGRRLYVTNNGTTTYRFSAPGVEGYNIALDASRIDLLSGRIDDITPYPVEAHLPEARNRQKVLGKYLLSPTAMVEDPDDESVFYVSSSIDGIYKMTDEGKLLGIYSELNSPLREFDGRNIAYHVSIDRGGNLWLNTATAATDGNPLYILPADKRRLDPSEVKATDWVTAPAKEVGYAGGQDVMTLHCSKANVSMQLNHQASRHYLMVYDNKGTLSNLADDRIKIWTRFTDQDGNSFAPNRCSAICEDLDGAVWIGTDQGPIVITNPANALNDNMTIRRVKVPKNDGSNTAEYLLGTDLVYDIAVDPANRKWIATARSGLFLVSANGTEILHNFTSENSPLPSNVVYSVHADPNSSTVYVGTAEGMFTYSSDASPSMPDFDNITVYPNPVTPDYSGPINIKGLMEGSLVKITDSAGRVVYQGRSEGGLFSFDGCNSAGRRLPSGVYYVFASQNANDSGSGGTAKFMIID